MTAYVTNEYYYYAANEPEAWGGGPSTLDSVLATRPAAPGSNPGVSEIFLSKKIVYVAEVNRQRCCLDQLVDSRGLITLIEPI